MEKSASLNGLILIGGKSRRMGTPKEKMVWHDKLQREYLADLLAPYCAQVCFSCRPEQCAELGQQPFPVLPDAHLDIGPMGGILSAFESDTHSAWLVLACDLPFVNEQALKQLIAHRDSSKMVTAFRNPINGLPEPLIAIWEPQSYRTLQEVATAGNYALRQALDNMPVQILTPADPTILFNVNTPQEAKQVPLIAAARQGR